DGLGVAPNHLRVVPALQLLRAPFHAHTISTVIILLFIHPHLHGCSNCHVAAREAHGNIFTVAKLVTLSLVRVLEVAVTSTSRGVGPCECCHGLIPDHILNTHLTTGSIVERKELLLLRRVLSH